MSTNLVKNYWCPHPSCIASFATEVECDLHFKEEHSGNCSDGIPQMIMPTRENTDENGIIRISYIMGASKSYSLKARWEGYIKQIYPALEKDTALYKNMQRAFYSAAYEQVMLYKEWYRTLNSNQIVKIVEDIKDEFTKFQQVNQKVEKVIDITEGQKLLPD